MKYLRIEQGPIRPPSEARSLLLRVTRNCSWNNCQFCTTYRGAKFERRSVEEVKADIDTVVEMISEIKSMSWRMGAPNQITAEVTQAFLNQGLDYSYQQVAAWMYYGTQAVFLQDANNLILAADKLAEMLEYLNEKVPDISRITTYSRTQTAARKSVEDLKMIRKAGLSRVHVGVESGSAKVLKFMKKGATPQAHIDGGRNIIDAGMELSEYYMPGLGGKELWQDHAVETAKVISATNPHFIRLRTLHVAVTHPLYKLVESGDFELSSDEEIVKEIRMLIENLDGIDSYLVSDHMGNLLQTVEGRLPDDKPKMLAALDAFLSLPEEDRLHYKVGRLMGVYNGVQDMEQDELRQQVDQSVARLKLKYSENLDEALVGIHDRLTR